MTKTSPRSLRVAAVLAILSAIGIAGCGNPTQKTAENYLNDLKLRGYSAIYGMLSHQDQVDRAIEDFLKDIPLAPDVSKDWFKPVLQETQFELGDAKMEGDSKAVVPVKVTMPDLALWERTIDAAIGNSGPADAEAQKSLQDQKYPKISYDDALVLVKEGGDWRVFVDYPSRDKIKTLHKDAVDLYHKHDYDKAIAAYQDLLAACDKDEATGIAGLKFLYGNELKDVQNAKAQIPEALAYVPKLALADVDLKMGASRVPGIFGKISNTGDKAIDEVQMTVTYYLGKGKRKKAVYTEDHPAIVTPLEFTNFSRTVLPFVPGETRDFGFRLTAPPDIQQKATPDLTVTSIVFTQSQAPLPQPPAPSPSAAGSPAAGGPAAAAPPAAGGAAPPPMPPPPPPMPPPPPPMPKQ
jgi:tetratricopeptide (TPR) repeat protein